MKISRNWLQGYFNDTLPATQELVHALTFHAFEIDGVERHQDDDVLDVKVTPNRGHDALSHRGVAKELSAILKIPLKAEYDPLARPVDLSKKTEAVKVSIEDPNLCRRYIAGYITGVKVGPSPEWLKKSLEAIGQRSINNIVDATNLVMFNIGQPLHAFDAKKLSSLSIGVRRARDGETIESLEAKTYTLKSSMLLITAGDVPAGIAGVKGGMATGIDEGTTDIVVESANFDGPTTRRTAAALKLSTDASQRFQQVISPELAAYGMQQVVDIITQVAGGSVEGFVDEYPSPITNAPVRLHAALPGKALGTAIDKDAIRDAFARLGFVYVEEGDDFVVAPPVERLDLQIPEDLVEEVGRIVGYEKVPGVELPPPEKQPEINQNFAAAERVRADLIAEGYSEIFTSIFADEGEVAVLNKVDSVRPFLRGNLTDGLTEALAKNKQNKDLLGLKEVKLFEIGTVWKGGAEEMKVGIVSEKKAAQEEPLAAYIKKVTAYDELPRSQTERYRPFSKYPSITRDIAMWVPSGTKAEDVLAVIQSHAGELLVRSDLFDTFQKGDKQSLAFRLVFQSFSETLTDGDANDRMESVYQAVKEKKWEVR